MSDRSAATSVLLTRSSREHIYVANQLLRDCSLTKVFVEVPRSRKGFRQEWKRTRRRYGLLGLVERLLLRLWHMASRRSRRREATLARILGNDSDAMMAPELIHEVADLNGADVLGYLREQTPDLILVYGTGIISDEILSLTKIGALNLHTGISPYYRGSDCAFWPVHDRRFDLLGATVHECTSAVDGGAILSTVRADLEVDDSIDAIFARCVKVGGVRYRTCVEKVLSTGEIRGSLQDPNAGREFRAAMRGIRAEMNAWRTLRSGAVKEFLGDEGAT